MQSRQFVTKLHQNALNRVLNFKKISGVTPRSPIHWGLCHIPPGEGREEKGKEGEGMREGMGEGKGEGGGKGPRGRE